MALELSAIVSDDSTRDTKTCYEFAMYELLYYRSSYTLYRLGFDPLSEHFLGDDQELEFTGLLL